MKSNIKKAPSAEPAGEEPKNAKVKTFVTEIKEKPWFSVVFSLILLVIYTIVATASLNYYFNYNIAKEPIYLMALALGGIWLSARWYQGKTDLEDMAKLSLTHLIVILISLPLISGILGYGINHAFSWKNEIFQKNEVVKAGRDRRQGMEAEIIRNFKVGDRAFKKGEVLPLVLINNSIQEEQRGPYKFVLVYVDEKKTAWVSLEDAIPRPKTIKLNGHNLNIEPNGKVWKITFTTDERLVIWESWPKGKTIVISSFGNDTVYLQDGSWETKVPKSGIVTSGITQPLEIKYKKGGILYISSN